MKNAGTIRKGGISLSAFSGEGPAIKDVAICKQATFVGGACIYNKEDR